MAEEEVPRCVLFPYDPLTPEQLSALAEFGGIVDATPLSPGLEVAFKTQREIMLSKFLTARKWKVADAAKMLVEVVRWRNEKKLDTTPLFPAAIPVRGYDIDALVEFQGVGPRPKDELDEIYAMLRPVYSSVWHKWDKSGRPLYIERTGQIRTHEMVARCKALTPPGGDISQPSLAAHLHANEVGGIILKYQNARRQPGTRDIAEVTVIMDCDGLTLGHLFGPAMDMLKTNSAVDQAHYPEGLYQLYVANAPKMITIAWSLVKGWIDPRVQKKVLFFKPHETKEQLRKYVDDDCLPAFLGGSCDCPGGCCPQPSIEESDEASGEDCLVARTEQIVVSRGTTVEKRVPLAQSKTLYFEYVVQDKKDVTFSVSFVCGEANKEIEAPSLKTEGSGQFTAESDGELVFCFDNKHAWVKAKTIAFRGTLMDNISSP